MVMKGQVTLIYAIVFGIIAGIIIAAAFSAAVYRITGGKGAKITEIQTVRDLYVDLNALKSAKLYLTSSLDYSVYQAVYDNGISGGWSETTGHMTFGNKLDCGNYCTGLKKELLGDNILGCGDGAYGCEVGEKNALNHDYRVGSVQCILKNLIDPDTGNPYHSSGIDCKFGQKTLEVVKGFQEDHKNDPDNPLTKTDGIVYPETVNKLKELFSENWDNCGDFFKNCVNRVYVYWDQNKKPDPQQLKENLEISVKEKFRVYTGKNYNFMGKFVNLPSYEKVMLGLQDEKIRVEAESKENLVLSDSHQNKKEDVVLESSSEIRKTYDIRYLKLYEKSVEAFDNLIANKPDCSSLKKSQKIKDNEDLGDDFSLTESVEDIKTPCELTVKVEVTDKKTTDGKKGLPVHTGSEISFEPVKMVFVAKV